MFFHPVKGQTNPLSVANHQQAFFEMLLPFPTHSLTCVCEHQRAIQHCPFAVSCIKRIIYPGLDVHPPTNAWMNVPKTATLACIHPEWNLNQWMGRSRGDRPKAAAVNATDKQKALYLSLPFLGSQPVSQFRNGSAFLLFFSFFSIPAAFIPFVMYH